MQKPKPTTQDKIDRFTALCGLFASETRVKMAMAADGHLGVGELAEAAGVTIQSSSQHLAKLRPIMDRPAKQANVVYHKAKAGVGAELASLAKELLP